MGRGGEGCLKAEVAHGYPIRLERRHYIDKLLRAVVSGYAAEHVVRAVVRLIPDVLLAGPSIHYRKSGGVHAVQGTRAGWCATGSNARVNSLITAKTLESLIFGYLETSLVDEDQ